MAMIGGIIVLRGMSRIDRFIQRLILLISYRIIWLVGIKRPVFHHRRQKEMEIERMK